MIHVIRGALTADVHLECDGCGAGGPSARYRGPDALAADRIRLRIAARTREGWGSRTLPCPEAGTPYRADLCHACLHRRGRRERRPGRRRE